MLDGGIVSTIKHTWGLILILFNFITFNLFNHILSFKVNCFMGNNVRKMAIVCDPKQNY